VTKHTPFRLALELARAEQLAAEWAEAYAGGKPVDEASRRTESHPRKKAKP